MILTLLAVSLNDQALTRPIAARFDANGGTIGRADHSTLALPDPERFISRTQAEIVFMGDGFLIRNVGAANPITVSGRVLVNGETTTLRDGDQVRLGGYLLRAECATATTVPAVVSAPASALAKTPAKPPTPTSTPTPAPPPPSYAPPAAEVTHSGLSANNPFADLLGPAAAATAPSVDPFAGLMRSPAPATDPFAGMMAAPAGLGSRSAAVAAPPPLGGTRLPDDFDPFASLSPAAAQPAAAPQAQAWDHDDPLAALSPAARAPSIDSAFDLLAPTQGDDPLARFTAELTAPPAAESGVSTDPLAMFADAAPIRRPADPVQRDDLPGVHAAFTAPPVAARGMAAARAPAAPTRSASGDEDALWQAFCEGAGVRLPLPPGSGPERMRAIGRVMRSAVDGTLQLMTVRASTKSEMRAAVTQIQARSNNPLKFAPDPSVGVEQMVMPPTRGFLDGPAAMEDAMHDLVGHSIGTVAGMRAAIEGMLDRFDPAALEAKLTDGSVLDSLLPAKRKARLWELYLQHHRGIRDEAQEDFHALFGKAFVAAYEQQVDRLKRGGRS